MSVTQPSLHARPRDAATATTGPGVAIVVAIAAAVLAIVVVGQIVRFDGNLTGFIEFGRSFAGATRPPHGALFAGPLGYDGQFFWIQAHDPLLLHASTLAQMRATGELYRIQRLGYPLLAFLLAGGQASVIPAALLAINVIVVLAVTGGCAAWLRRHDCNTLWALAIGLAPGMLLPTLRDLSDPLSTACVLLAVLAWQARRRWPAALALTAAVLTREVMIAVVVAIVLEASVRARRERGNRSQWRAVVREALPVVVIPGLAFAVWQGYVIVRAGGPVGTSTAAIPFTNLIAEARSGIPNYGPVVGGGDVIYVALIFAAVVLAARALARGIDVLSAAAAALCVSVVIPQFGDFWSDTRLSAPLFIVLLLDGVQRRDRPQIVVSSAAAAMSIVFLLAV